MDRHRKQGKATFALNNDELAKLEAVVQKAHVPRQWITERFIECGIEMAEAGNLLDFHVSHLLFREGRTLTIRLTEEYALRLKAQVERMGVLVSDLVRFFVLTGIESYERYRGPEGLPSKEELKGLMTARDMPCPAPARRRWLSAVASWLLSLRPWKR